MTEALYLKDSYLKEFDARVIKACGKLVFLDRTAFYPLGGGQPFDTGTLEANGEKYEVVSVSKTNEGIAHEIDREGLKKDDAVHGKINWDRRYKVMRMHTASHALSSMLYEKMNAKITGNKITGEQTSVDFNLENLDRKLFEKSFEECNAKLAKGAKIELSWMSREKALENPELVKLANVLPPAVKELRIVTIPGIDRQADGGTHVNNTKEVGRLDIIKFENKGKGRKRVYFKLVP